MNKPPRPEPPIIHYINSAANSGVTKKTKNKDSRKSIPSKVNFTSKPRDGKRMWTELNKEVQQKPPAFKLQDRINIHMKKGKREDKYEIASLDSYKNTQELKFNTFKEQSHTAISVVSKESEKSKEKGLNKLRTGYLNAYNNHELRCWLLSLESKRRNQLVGSNAILLKIEKNYFRHIRGIPSPEDQIRFQTFIKRLTWRFNNAAEVLDKMKQTSFLTWKLKVFGWKQAINKNITQQFYKRKLNEGNQQMYGKYTLPLNSEDFRIYKLYPLFRVLIKQRFKKSSKMWIE